MKDRQREKPAAWCRWCGRELYPGQEVWTLWGGLFHDECLGEYALANCEHWTLGEERQNGNA